MYTYAFLRQPTSSFSLPEGIAEPLQIVSSAGLSALVEPKLDFESLQQSDDRLVQAVLSHDRIVRLTFQQTEILPLRFGTRFVSREGLLEHLEAHRTEYLEKLTQLTGKAEYTLKLLPVDFQEPSISSEVKGKDYFLAKKQRYQVQLDQQQQQQQELNQLQETIAQIYPNPVLDDAKEGVERIYLLAERKNEPTLYQHVQQWQAACPTWEITIGEALPPYHFV